MDELKPCPCHFCGKKTSTRAGFAADDIRVEVYCICGATGPTKSTHEDAIAAWNARAPSVPEGWRLVPVVPTQEMLKSADDALMFTYRASDWDEAKDVIEGLSLKEIYDKFIAAAPKVTP